MRSPFQFINYKIDRLRFQTVHSTGLVRANFFKGRLITEVALRSPQFFKQDNTYYGGFDCIVSLMPDDDEKIFSIESGIMGAFAFEKRLEDELERNLVLKQIPTILFPYLRAAITSFLANAGFGSIMIPLINMHTIAKEYEDITVEIVE